MAIWSTVAKNAPWQSRLVVAGLFIPLAILNPTLLLAHGHIWIAKEASSGILVYAMKLTPLLYLAAAALALGPSGVAASFRTRVLLPMSLVFCMGLATPFLFEVRPSLFYYAADAVGLATTFAYYLLTNQLLRSPDMAQLRPAIFRTMVFGAAITSAVIIWLFCWSGGEKVSIPPDIHYGIALAIVLYLTRPRVKFALAPVLIAAGIGAAQFRMNLLVAVGATAAAWLWNGIAEHWREAVLRAARTLLLILVLVFVFQQQLTELVGRMGMFEWRPTAALTQLQEPSGSDPQSAVDQRYVESFLVYQELIREPLSLIVGKGFGATFDTKGTLSGHGAREHSVHNSIAALWLRNGILGVVLFAVPGLLALRTLVTRDRGLYVASIGLLGIYLACMTDQYVYWGGYLGIAMAVWYWSWQSESKIGQKPNNANA